MTASNGPVGDVVEGIVQGANDRGIKIGGEWRNAPKFHLAREETNMASYTDQFARPFEHDDALLVAQRDLACIDRKVTHHTGSNGPPAQPRINADLDDEAVA